MACEGALTPATAGVVDLARRNGPHPRPVGHPLSINGEGALTPATAGIYGMRGGIDARRGGRLWHAEGDYINPIGVSASSPRQRRGIWAAPTTRYDRVLSTIIPRWMQYWVRTEKVKAARMRAVKRAHSAAAEAYARSETST